MALEERDEYLITANTAGVFMVGFAVLAVSANFLFPMLTIPLLALSGAAGFGGLICLNKVTDLDQKKLDDFVKAKEKNCGSYPSHTIEVSPQIEIEPPSSVPIAANTLSKKSSRYR